MGIFVIFFALLLCFWFLIFIALVYRCVYIVIILHNIFFTIPTSLLITERKRGSGADLHHSLQLLFSTLSKCDILAPGLMAE